MPGTTVVIPWPGYWSDSDSYGVSIGSSDPNDHYRPWLEQHCGRQGWDWDWRVYALQSAYILNAPIEANSAVEIKFRKGKESIAVLAKLQWL